MTINPATDHVKAYDPDAWAKATHAAALHYWGMEYYEHDPAPLMEAVSAALYYLAPAIVRQVQQAVTATAIDTDRADVMLAAVRYAIGRQSYIGASVRRYVHAHLHEWPQVERERLAIAIDQAAEVAGQLGHEVVDRPGWLALRDALRGGE